MDLENINTSFEETLQEVQTMRLSDDENVLRCYSSFVQADKLWLVTQLMDKGSCCRVMSLAKAQGFGEGMNEEWLAYILKESLQGLRYLHEHGQIHRDIKGGNILLDSSGGVRLADFGVSGWTLSRGERKGSVKTFVGTPCWMAPEVMEQVEGYDSRADIWSIGITALELAKGYAPYARLPPMRVLLLTIEEEPPSLRNYPDNKQRTGAPFSRYFTDFVQKCLSKNPKMRPDAEEILYHKFFRDRNKDALVSQLLNQIPSVGDDDSDSGATVADVDSIIPGGIGDSENYTVSGMVGIGTNKKNLKIIDNLLNDNNKGFVKGTTWIFDDSTESNSDIPVRSGASSSNAASNAVSVVDFLNDFDEDTATLKDSKATVTSNNSTSIETDITCGAESPVDRMEKSLASGLTLDVNPVSSTEKDGSSIINSAPKDPPSYMTPPDIFDEFDDIVGGGV